MFQLFLNELSFRNRAGDSVPLVDTRDAAVWLLGELVSTVRAGERLLLAKAFRMDPSILTQELSAGYRVGDWLEDRNVDRDTRLFIKRRAAMLPILVRYDCEVRVDGEICLGIAAAYLETGLALSVPSYKLWLALSVDATLTELNQAGTLIERPISVRQVSSHEQWTEHQAQEQERLLASAINGRKLVEVIGAAFTNLDVCGSAERQICDLDGHEKYFSWLKDSLRQADAAAAAWQRGEFPHGELPGPATGESRPVHESKELINMRYFVCVDGERRLHEHHMKHRGENIRIYYRFDSGSKRVSIGYVGTHLPTANY